MSDTTDNDVSQAGFLRVVEDSAPTTGNYVVMGSVLLAPTSVGSLTLASASAWDLPNIDTGFLSTAYDRYVMEAGM